MHLPVNVLQALYPQVRAQFVELAVINVDQVVVQELQIIVSIVRTLIEQALHVTVTLGSMIMVPRLVKLVLINAIHVLDQLQIA